jgi:hypothetical protein
VVVLVAAVHVLDSPAPSPASSGGVSGSAGIAAATAATPDTLVPLPASLADQVLFYGSSTVRLETVDGVAVGRPITTVTGPDPGQSPVLASGGRAVWVSKGGAWSVSAADSTPVYLGPADSVVALAGQNLVGLIQPGAPGDLLQDVGAHGQAVGQPVQLPADATVVGAVGADLLLQDPSGRLEDWDPATGRSTRSFGPASQVIAVSGTEVAWIGAGPCAQACPLHLTDVGRGVQTTVALPPGMTGWIGGGTFAPSGRMLATYAHASSGTWPDNVVLIDTADQHSAVLASVNPPKVGAPMAGWSSDGYWLLYGGSGFVNAEQVPPPGQLGAGQLRGYPAPYSTDVSAAGNPLVL